MTVVGINLFHFIQQSLCVCVYVASFQLVPLSFSCSLFFLKTSCLLLLLFSACCKPLLLNDNTPLAMLAKSCCYYPSLNRGSNSVSRFAVLLLKGAPKNLLAYCHISLSQLCLTVHFFIFRTLKTHLSSCRFPYHRLLLFFCTLLLLQLEIKHRQKQIRQGFQVFFK